MVVVMDGLRGLGRRLVTATELAGEIFEDLIGEFAAKTAGSSAIR
ncbi:hypothetical protein GCM10025866_00180 [Naasia aerilata]|uniref:Uncharacterized protein n=1 Tax=Naasia aerilata TaxID=1162966 RepID=A0ABN6XH19_9MICO|nr:hypothetical protein GCM10025866_00180 [Naasia aerilata]